MIAIHRASDDDAARWDAFVAGQAHATGYHEWAWRGVFARAFGHESIYLMALDGERLAGVLPLVQINSLVFGRTLTSLPFVNYGGVLASSPDAALALQERVGACGRERRCRHVELRHIARQFPELPCKQHKVTMKLTLVPDLWNALDGKVRNQIRKAQKSGLTGGRGESSCCRTSTAGSRATCATLAPPGMASRSSPKCCARFPAGRISTSCG